MTCLPLQVPDSKPFLHSVVCLTLSLSLVLLNQWFVSVVSITELETTALALFPNTIQMLLLPLKSGLVPHHSASSQPLISHGSLCGSWHIAGSDPLWSVHWNESISADQAISENTQRQQWRQRNAPMTKDIYGWGRLWLLAWKDKQSVSLKGSSHCNIDAVFIRLVIAKYNSMQVFSSLMGYVWNLRVLK